MTKTVKKCLFAFFMALLMLVSGAFAILSNVKSANADVSLTENDEKVISAANAIKNGDYYDEDSNDPFYWNIKVTDKDTFFLFGLASQISDIKTEDDYNDKKTLEFGEGEIETLADVEAMFDKYDSSRKVITTDEFISAYNTLASVVTKENVSYMYASWSEALKTAYEGFDAGEQAIINSATDNLKYFGTLTTKLNVTKTRIDDALSKMFNFWSGSNTLGKINVNNNVTPIENLENAYSALDAIYPGAKAGEGYKNLSERVAIDLSRYIGITLTEKDIIAKEKKDGSAMTFNYTFDYLFEEFNKRYAEYTSYKAVISKFETEVTNLYTQMYDNTKSKLDRFIFFEGTADTDDIIDGTKTAVYSIKKMEKAYADLATVLSTYTYFEGNLQLLVKTAIKNDVENSLGKYDQIVAGLATSYEYIGQWDTATSELEGIVNGNSNGYYQEEVKTKLDDMADLLADIKAYDSSIDAYLTTNHNIDYYDDACDGYDSLVEAIEDLYDTLDNVDIDDVYNDFDSDIASVYDNFCDNQETEFRAKELSSAITIAKEGEGEFFEIGAPYVENYELTTYGDLYDYLKAFKDYVAGEISDYDTDISTALNNYTSTGFTYANYKAISDLLAEINEQPEYVQNAVTGYTHLQDDLDEMNTEIAKAATFASLVNASKTLLESCDAEHIYTYANLVVIAEIYFEFTDNDIFSPELADFIKVGENLTEGVDQYNPYYDEYELAKKAMADFKILYPAFKNFVDALKLVTELSDSIYIAKVPGTTNAEIDTFISNYEAVAPLADALKVEEGTDYKEVSSVKYNTNDFFDNSVKFTDDGTKEARGRYAAYLTIQTAIYELEKNIENLFTTDNAKTEYESLSNTDLDAKIEDIEGYLDSEYVGYIRDYYSDKLKEADDAVQAIIGEANVLDSWLIAGMGDYAIEAVLSNLGVANPKTAIKNFFDLVKAELKLVDDFKTYNNSETIVEKAAKAYIEKHINSDKYVKADYTDLNGTLTNALVYEEIKAEDFETKFYADVYNIYAYLTVDDGIAYILKGIATSEGLSVKAKDINEAIAEFLDETLPTGTELAFDSEDLENNYDLSTLKLINIELDFFGNLDNEFNAINLENYYKTFAKQAHEKIAEITTYSVNLTTRLNNEIMWLNSEIDEINRANIDELMEKYIPSITAIENAYRAMDGFIAFGIIEDGTQAYSVLENQYAIFEDINAKLMWKMYYLTAADMVLDGIENGSFTVEGQVILNMLGAMYRSASPEYKDLIEDKYFDLVANAYPAYAEADIQTNETLEEDILAKVDAKVREKVAAALAQETASRNAKDNDLAKSNRDLTTKNAELVATDAKLQEDLDMLSSQLKDMKKLNTIATAVGAVGLIFALIALLKRKK